MYYPYREVERAAQQNPPPQPPKDGSFPTAITVASLYLAWVAMFGRKFGADDARPNAIDTIKRIGHTRLVEGLRYKHHMEKDPVIKAKYANVAWESYQKNLWNTVSGTCAGALARSELGKLSPGDLIEWLPSTANEPDSLHILNYWDVMTVNDALRKELCIRIGCKCGWSRM